MGHVTHDPRQIDLRSLPTHAAVLNTNSLPYSQTFVYEQLVNHVRYQAEVFCWRTENLDWFPYEKVHRANAAYAATRFSPAFYRRFRQQRFDVVQGQVMVNRGRFGAP